MPKEHEEVIEPEPFEERGAVHARPQAAGGVAQVLLFVAGTVLVLLGTALVYLPQVSPEQGWIVRSLAARGLTSLPVFAAGVLFCGLWVAVRTSRAHSIAAQKAALSSGPSLQQLFGQVSRLADNFQNLRIEIVYLKDAVQTQGDQVQASQANQANQASSSDGSGSDAMYRLAASLDQLGLRIDERLNANHRLVCETLREISEGIESARTLEAERRELLEEEAAARREDETEGGGERGLRWIAGGIAGGTDQDAAAEGADRDAAEARPRLGLLDLLDDLGRLLPSKTSPAVERPETLEVGFEEVQDEGWDQQASIPAALPSARSGPRLELHGGLHQGGEIHLTGPGELLAGGLDDDSGSSVVTDKLLELRSLLADDRVREALAAIERGRK